MGCSTVFRIKKKKFQEERKNSDGVHVVQNANKTRTFEYESIRLRNRSIHRNRETIAVFRCLGSLYRVVDAEGGKKVEKLEFFSY